MEQAMLEKNDQSKYSIIAKLYALRGGLSVISKISDSRKILEKNIAETKKTISYCSEIIPKSLEDKAGQDKSTYEKETAYLKNDVNDLTRKKKSCRSARISQFFKIFFRPGIWLFIVSLIIKFPAFFGLEQQDIYNLLGTKILNELIANNLLDVINNRLIYVVYICAIPAIISLINCFKDVKEYINCWISYAKISKQLKSIDKKYDEKLIQKAEFFAQVDHDYMNSVNSNNLEIENLNIKLKDLEEDMHVLMTYFEAAHRAVYDQFAKFLDERDWGNVDLIIFNFETGRALDMRDALIQVDTERRNMHLIEAVHEANESICSSISWGFNDLTTSLDTHFSLLKEKISGYTEKIIKLEESRSEQTEALKESISEKMDKLIEGNTARMALQEKMTTSSDKMAQEIKSLKEKLS